MLSLSTHLYVFYSLTSSIITEISEYGFNYIEIWGTLPHFHYDDEEYLKKVAEALFAREMEIASFHAPFYTRLENKKPADPFSLSYCDEKERIRGLDEIRRFLESIYKIEFPMKLPVPIVLHTGFSADFDIKCQWEKLVYSFETLMSEVRGTSFILALENGSGGLDDPEWVAEFVTGFSSPYLRVCLDIGHANITSPDWLNNLKNYVDMVVDFHVHDNRGKIDEHLPPGEGSIDFEKFLSLTGGARLLTLELMDYSRGEKKEGVHEPLRKSVEFFKRRGVWKQFTGKLQ